MAVQSDGDILHGQTGVLLVGHGTRSELGGAQFRELAAEVAGLLSPQLFSTQYAFLELASPSIEEAIARLTRQPLKQLIVVPLLLFSAGHAQQDIPRAVHGALGATGHSDLPVLQTPPLGLHPAVVEIAEQRVREVATDFTNWTETCLLLIGRGSRDAQATAQMQQLGKILHARLGVGETRVGFIAMAEPSAVEVLSWAVASPFRQVIVQPHLFFEGDLVEQLRQEVAHAAALAPQKIWRMASILMGQRGAGIAAADSLAAAIACAIPAAARMVQPG